jgi:hypothetical protein
MNMTDQDFRMHVDSLASIKLKEPKDMYSQCEIYWNEILSQQNMFNRSIKLALLIYLIKV